MKRLPLDPQIHTMALQYQSQSLDEAGLKRLAELPDELTAAGYGPIFPLLVQIFRLLISIKTMP